jgi:hypothetical protein
MGFKTQTGPASKAEEIARRSDIGRHKVQSGAYSQLGVDAAIRAFVTLPA